MPRGCNVVRLTDLRRRADPFQAWPIAVARRPAGGAARERATRPRSASQPLRELASSTSRSFLGLAKS
eukprot:7972693-Alexandrium_andersonii.AAC.1